jgi:hypothetical protein
MLDSFDVKGVATPPRSTEAPLVEGKTTLESIIGRMLPAQSPDLDFYQMALADMDSKYGLWARFLKQYEDARFLPRVHAEITVLEHFYGLGLTFAGLDRYIACSKPACYCCLLYFRHHPGNFVEPAGHNNIWLNWKVPDVKTGPIVNENHQRDILNSMTKDIRKAALDQIRQRDAPHARHPDSATGITRTTSNAIEFPEGLSDIASTDGLGITQRDMEVNY